MARKTNLEFLQVLIFHNMPILRSRTEWASQATSLVMSALRDITVEVRETAGEVLGGLLHCDFIPDPSTLLVRYHCMSKGLNACRPIHRSLPLKYYLFKLGQQTTHNLSPLQGSRWNGGTHTMYMRCYLPQKATIPRKGESYA